jgi:tetratricopeptide (TPR) repeat protein
MLLVKIYLGLIGPIVFLLFILPQSLLRITLWAYRRQAWRLARVAFIFPRTFWNRVPLVRYLDFIIEVISMRERGEIGMAAELAATHCSQMIWAEHRNLAIDILISAGDYRTALAAGLAPYVPIHPSEVALMNLIQINLSEAECNLGLWSEADARLRDLDETCDGHPITRGGLLVQRAWIAAHSGRVEEAIALCAAIDTLWFPSSYRAEHHFCSTVAFLAAGRLDEAEAALARSQRELRRLSSKRNFLILRARLSAARGDWVSAERDCRAAAEHPHRGQGGDGFVLWAEALRKLGRDAEAVEALRLLQERDPQSEAAQRHRQGALPLGAQGA